jgi:hypothetical protein
MTRQEFETKFWDLWFEGQTEKERAKPWLPSKRPHQIPHEFLECLWLCSSEPVPLVLEIGTMGGHQKRFWQQLLNADYIGIDISEEAPADIYGNSSLPETRDKVLEISAGRRPNIIFIDGNHSYKGVKADWDLWHTEVDHPGFICFHDTHHDHAKYASGPVELWQEITQDRQFLSWDIFFKVDYLPRTPTGESKQCGIGVIAFA